MGNRKESVSGKVNEAEGIHFLNVIKEALVSALATTIAAAFFTVIWGYVNHFIIGKPVLNVMVQNKSFIIDETVSDAGERTITRNIYEGIEIANPEKQDNRYLLISGNPSNPGYITVALRLTNIGNLHARVTGCELDLVEYKSLYGVEYAAHVTEQTSNPDEYVVLYGNVDPAVKVSHTIKAKISAEGSIKTDSYQFSERIKPKEYKIFYVKIKLLKHGIYRIRPVIQFLYRDKSDIAVSDQTIDIIYDNLDKQKLEEKEKQLIISEHRGAFISK